MIFQQKHLLICLMALLWWPLAGWGAEAPLAVGPATHEMLRHEKHALLTHHFLNERQLEAVLVTRNKVYRQVVPIPGNFREMVTGFQRRCLTPPRDSAALESWFDASHELFGYLVAPFLRELEDLYQLTVVPEESMVGLPFEALVLDGGAPLPKRKFLTEVWAVSYLPDLLALAPVRTRPEPDDIKVYPSPVNLAETAREATSSRSGCALLYRWEDPAGDRTELHSAFMALVDTGAYVDEALGLARSDWFRDIRADRSSPSTKLHPYYWASAALYGDIYPLHRQWNFPWWVLTLLGFVLIVLLGKKL